MQTNMSDQLIGRGRHLLDCTYASFPREPGQIARTMADLLQSLCRIRREMPHEQWERFCREVVPGHKLTALIHQDPFTLHSVQKPRGYAGDAMLLDYIYGQRNGSTTTIGKSIFDFTTNTPPCRAVRARARIIAGIIDRMARQRKDMRILSIACGHLREAEMSEAVRAGKVSEYVAFDQDAESLAHVRAHFSSTNFKTIQGSIAELLLGRLRTLGQFDLVYAAGLYDYLSQKIATRLTTWMFNTTRARGITLLTNFLHDTAGAGYMEAFMEWNLIYRSTEELRDTARRIPSERITDMKDYVDEDEQVAFIELHKAERSLPTRDRAYRPSLAQQATLRAAGRNKQTISS